MYPFSLRSFSLRHLAPLAAALLLACSDGGGGSGSAPQSCSSDSQCGSGYSCKFQQVREATPGLSPSACDPLEDPFCEPGEGSGGSGPGSAGSDSGSGNPGNGSGGSGTSSAGSSQQGPMGRCVANSPSGSAGSGQGSGGSGQAQGGSDAGGTSSSGGSGSSSPKALGSDCSSGSECADGKCLLFTGNDGKQYGFCTRTCVKAEDCPESGWVCNLSPYTACVPQN